MMRNGKLYQQPMWARSICEKEYGLLHTPTATANQDSPSMRERDNGSYFPTPRANKISGGDRIDFSPSLHNVVKRFPIPMAVEIELPADKYDLKGNSLGYRRLSTLVKKYPSPIASDANDAPKNRYRTSETYRGNLSEAVRENEESAQLNPDWEELLMGYPKGWTDIDKENNEIECIKEKPFNRDWENGTPRITTKKENRRKRIKALGNSIVPQVAYEIMKRIKPLL